jgi:hypothetical protein
MTQVSPSIFLYLLVLMTIFPVKALIKVLSMFDDLCSLIITCVLTQILKKAIQIQVSKIYWLVIVLLRNDNKEFADLDPIFKSHDLHLFYVSMHGNARKYKEQVKTYNDSRKQEGKKAKKPRSVEMNNFQNPQ